MLRAQSHHIIGTPSAVLPYNLGTADAQYQSRRMHAGARVRQSRSRQAIMRCANEMVLRADGCMQ
eukprot:scaffold180708_cov17-Tisochrysis_lutea.AAC.1